MAFNKLFPFLLSLLLSSPLSYFCVSVSVHAPWMDPSAPVEERVAALLLVMTNDEKQVRL